MARLTRKLENGRYAQNYTTGDGFFVGMTEMMQKLGELEDLEEAGRLVELPCKVGDTVREVDKPLGIIAGWRVTEFVIHEDVVFAENPYLGEYCDIKEFGKTVFLTREEAEAALKGVE